MKNLSKLTSYCLILALLIVGLFAGTASATFPGDNGKILLRSFNGSSYSWVTIDDSGGNQTLPAVQRNSAYSPTGARVAYQVSQNLWVSNIDGSNQAQITSDSCVQNTLGWSPDEISIAYGHYCGAGNHYLALAQADTGGIWRTFNFGSTPIFRLDWSPSGNEIAYELFGGDTQIYKINIHTGTITQLATAGSNVEPRWSPDGTQIVFRSGGEIYKMNADGSGQTRLTNNSFSEDGPIWSPDGTKIIYTSDHGDNGTKKETYKMNTDGSGETMILTGNDSIDYEPVDWQPANVKPFVYRFWSQTYQHHFYTASYTEALQVINNYPDTVWQYEKVAYKAKTGTCSGGQSPVHRFWSDTYRGHFFTISTTEKNHIIATYRTNVWRYEGQAFCGNTTQVAGTVPLYRFWSDTYKGHFFTTSEAEKQHVIDAYPDNVWKYEGVAYFVFP